MAGMDSLGWLQAAGGILQLIGGMSSAKAATAYGKAQQSSMEFQAWYAEEQAGTAIAVSQRAAEEQRRLGRMQASRMLALAAASGGGASDPSIVRLIAHADSEAAYRASVALYEGEARSRQLRFDAATGRASGANAALEGATRGVGLTLASAGAAAKTIGGGLYRIYGNGGPNNQPSGDAGLIRDTSTYGTNAGDI